MAENVEGKHGVNNFRKQLLSLRSDFWTYELRGESLRTPVLRPPRRATAQLQVTAVRCTKRLVLSVCSNRRWGLAPGPRRCCRVA